MQGYIGLEQVVYFAQPGFVCAGMLSEGAYIRAQVYIEIATYG